MAINISTNASEDQRTQQLGELLLKGWIMTDQVCPEPRDNMCIGVPLMRSRDSEKLLCVACKNNFLNVQGTIKSEIHTSDKIKKNDCNQILSQYTNDILNNTEVAISKQLNILCERIEHDSLSMFHSNIINCLNILHRIKSLRQ